MPGLLRRPLPSPECGGEEREDGEDFESSEEHADGEDEAAEGVDDLETLCSSDLVEAGADVVQSRRHRRGRGEGGQVCLQGHDKGRYAEDPYPGREEAQYGDADRLGHDLAAELERRDGARVDHPEYVLQDRAEDDEDADDLDPARGRPRASPDEHKQDEDDFCGRIPLVEVDRYEPRRGDDTRDGERRVPERGAPRISVVALEDED